MRNIILLFTVLLLTSVSSFSQNLSIGVVDTEKIAAELPEFKDIESQLRNLSKKYQDSLVSMRGKLEQKYADLQKQMAMMPEAQKAQAQQELQTELMALQQFEQEKLGNQGEVARKQAEMIGPIRENILKVIEQVAAENKIDLVLDKADTPLGSVVLYSAKKIDLTYKVLDRLLK